MKEKNFKPAVFIFLNAKTKETVKLAANLYTLKPSLAHLGLSVDIVRNELSDFYFVSNKSVPFKIFCFSKRDKQFKNWLNSYLPFKNVHLIQLQ